MFFRGSPINRPTRILAALVVLSFGSAMIASAVLPAVLLGATLAGVGVFFAGAESYRWFQDWRHREDPYDLTRLWDAPLPEKSHELEPEEDGIERDYALCHHCGDAVARGYAICPRCGCVLGG